MHSVRCAGIAADCCVETQFDFAACRDLANAPSDQAIRNALNKQLPEMKEPERRLNAALATPVLNIVFRRQRDAAIDLTLIPYHGKPYLIPNEHYHSMAKSGTTKFHAYATLYVIHEGWYRRRFAIESSYLQMHQARVRTCTRCPKFRFFFAFALILRNVWLWLHCFIFADGRGETPSLRLELLRFRRMLAWLAR